MMRVSYVGLIICHIVALTRSESPPGIEFITRCRSNSGCEILRTSESRYRSKDSHLEYVKRDYVKKKSDLPVNFRAPNYAAYDYWGYKEEQHREQQQRQQQQEQQQNHRRTFFEDAFYYPQDKRTAYPRVPDFYQFVTSMFGIGGEATTRTEDYRHDRNPATSPYPYETPGLYDFRPTQPNYIPPPKPIRASVIKLETITRPPNLYPSFDYDTGKFYQNFGNILNPVIIQNSKNSQNSNFHDLPRKLTSNTGVSFPVLSKPLAPPPTTLKPPPEFSIFSSDRPSPGLSYSSKNRTRTDYKYPDSVQDKLPPIDFARIPYILTTFVPSVTTTLPSETLPTTDYDGKFFFPTNPPAIPKSSTKLIDVRNLSRVNTGNRQQSTTEIERIKNFDFDVTTFESLEKPIQRIRGPLSESIRRFNPSNETSVEIITNLTVEGLSKGKNDNANIQNHVNYFNVRNLISYEMNKLKNIPEPDRFQRKSFGNDSQTNNGEELLSHLVNFSDELSLDAKILKDTNWDGFSTTPPTLTIQTLPTKRQLLLNPTQIQVETSPNPESIQQFRFEPTFESQTNQTKPKKDFWESDVETGTTAPYADITTTTRDVKTTTEQPTTTDILSFSTVSETTETTELVTSPEVLTTQTENSASVNRKDTSEQQTTAEPLNKTTTTEIPTSREISKMSPSPESTTPYFQKRKYSRRAKFLSYTPYTTSTTTTTSELPRKVFNRNNFPRRQKPNITLAFGNKNIIKTVETYAKDEVMKFSDEDLTKKKRKPGKRRRSYKRRNSTSEPTISE